MDRLRCSAFLAMSLDGFIAREDGRVDWLGPFENEEHGYQAFLDSVDVLVVGRNTYEFVLGLGDWPYAGKRCVVLSRRPAPSRHGEEFLAGSPARRRGEPRPHRGPAGLRRRGSRGELVSRCGPARRPHHLDRPGRPGEGDPALPG